MNQSIVYAFPTYDDNGGNTEEAITRSLLYQLCRAIWSIILVVNKERDCSHLLNLWGNLLEAFICGSEPVYIILDGLDECDEIERKQLLRTVRGLLKNCSNLHVLVASRKGVDVRPARGENCETLIVKEKNRTDIEQFVAKEINDLWGEISRHIPGLTAGEFFKIAHNIVNQSEGAGFTGRSYSNK